MFEVKDTIGRFSFLQPCDTNDYDKGKLSRGEYTYPEGSLELLQEGETIAQDLKDGSALAYFQSNMGFYYVTSGNDPVKGRKYLERGLEWSEPTANVAIIAPAAFDLIASYSFEGNHAQVCQVTPKLIALIEKTHTESELFGRPDNIYSLLNSIYGQSLGLIGRFAEAKPFLEKGLFFARDMNNLLSLALVEMNYGIFYLIKGDGEKCVKHLQASIEYMEKSQFHLFLGPVWAWLGWGYRLSDRIDKAIKCAEKGLEIHTDLGLLLFLGTIHNTLGDSHLKAGDLKKAMIHAKQALDLSRKNNEKLAEAEARILLGRVIASTERKQFVQAREQILKGISMHEEHKRKPGYAIGLLCLGEIYAEAGQTEAALENLKKAQTLFQEMGMVYWPDKAREILAAL